MTLRARLLIAVVCAASILGPAQLPAIEAGDEAPGYAALVSLFEEWRSFQQPVFVDGVPDYSAAAMKRQHRELADYRQRLGALETDSWPVDQQIDYALVWAEMNGLDFDHRVLRPWARDPAFYAMVVESESDTPLKEGPLIAGAIELWRWSWPLSDEAAGQLRGRLGSIPTLLEQARINLTGDARDLWSLGIGTQEVQSRILGDLADRLAEHHPELVEDAERARDAVNDFRDWLADKLPEKQGPSGIGVENYSWYLRNVHLVPYTWEDELRLMERELARSISLMALEEHQNRHLPTLEPPSSEAAWEARNEAATVEFLRFLDEERVLELEDYMEPALRARLQPWAPPGSRHFFAQVNMRDPRVLHCHFIHWLEKARMEERPHASPIRRNPPLYNIWDSRSEGLATAMEEMMLAAGMFQDSPRSRELVYIMVAMRAARAIAGLRVQSNEWSVDEAVEFAAGRTPRGWFRADGNLVLREQQLYLRQPGYGTSYLTGKTLIDRLLAERALELGEAFSLETFMTELLDSGMIPVSLVGWELTGRRPDLAPSPSQARSE